MGTEIEEGDWVIAHALGKFPRRGYGVVTRIGKTVTVKLEKQTSRWRDAPAYMIVGPDSVTVLTEDMASKLKVL
jgi:hypothetical protein